MEQPLGVMAHFMSLLKCKFAGYNCEKRSDYMRATTLLVPLITELLLVILLV